MILHIYFQQIYMELRTVFINPILETPFSETGSTWSSVNTPDSAQSLANRLAAITVSQAPISSTDSTWDGVKTPDTAQSTSNKLAEDERSAAAYMMSTFSWEKVLSKREWDFAIEVGRDGKSWLLRSTLVRKERKLFDKIFGKYGLMDPTKFPAASLLDDDNDVFGMFLTWATARNMKPLNRYKLFQIQNCTREDRLRTIDTLLRLIYFADKYALDVFQDEVLRLLIEATKEERSPLGIYHVRQCHENTSPKSKTRLFLIDLIAFIVQENESERPWEERKTSVDCDLAQSNEELLVDLLDLLEGREIRASDGHVTDPREALDCVYHQYGSGEECPRDVCDSVIENKDFMTDYYW
ncbi:hypothetical protein SBOR_8455 [Sclerotinia borealis F-4128]|uniref:BTB domain-containing protein n=1 Tax=Sclerotinia borealis (strain F-4128) TaxID=1432307 RepID=W9C5Z7_SCLBF|nr:hypothetical protein SBOR_8455 [Sclerotinia borealis F-4128]